MGRMEMVNYNRPGSGRQAPYYKGTMVELNQSYEVEQVVQQKHDVMEILVELAVNFSKNKKKLNGFDEKLKFMKDDYEKKFTKQQLLLEAKLHEIKQKCDL